jgi:hypothetical protein
MKSNRIVISGTHYYYIIIILKHHKIDQFLYPFAIQSFFYRNLDLACQPEETLDLSS